MNYHQFLVERSYCDSINISNPKPTLNNWRDKTLCSAINQNTVLFCYAKILYTISMMPISILLYQNFWKLPCVRHIKGRN